MGQVGIRERTSIEGPITVSAPLEVKDITMDSGKRLIDILNSIQTELQVIGMEMAVVNSGYSERQSDQEKLRADFQREMSVR